MNTLYELAKIIFLIIFVTVSILIFKIRFFKNDTLNYIFCIALILIFISLSNIFTAKSNYLNNHKISVIILNFKRPHNLVKSLPILNSYNIIDEIIISHGNPSTYQKFNFSKVRNFKDFDIDKEYGSAIRFLRVMDCKNDIILFLDDDILPTELAVNRSHKILMNNYERNTLYGHIGRVCKKNGYIHTESNMNVVLTPFLMCKRKIVIDYLKDKKYGFEKYKKFFGRFKGNCEDLSLNHYIEKEYLENPILIPNDGINELDISNGHSTVEPKKHQKLRNNFCRYLNFLD